MTALSLNDPLRNVLPNLDQPLVVRDENGQLVGYYVLKRLAADAEMHIDEEEVQRIIKEGKGRPLADILADLGKRA